MKTPSDGQDSQHFEVFAAMHEDIAQGIVWLPRDGRPARCIVKITNPRSGKSIFVERLEFDENFRKRYNQRRLPRSIEHVDSAAIVINQWYRSTLCIETNHKYPLGIHTPNRWWGNLRAILQHPQVAVRISCWLGILGVVLGLLSLALSLPTAIGKVAFPRRSPQIVQLSAQDALDRRTSYEELLGKTRQELVQKLGTPQKETESSPYWNSSPQTQGRGIRIGIAMLTDPDKSRQESFVILVEPSQREALDSTEIFKKAPMFTYQTGKYANSVNDYFLARSSDKKSEFQFDVTDRGLKFRRVAFSNAPVP